MFRFRAVFLLLLSAVILLSSFGCAVKSSPVAMTVGDNRISAREYAYFLQLNASYVDPEQGDDGEASAKESATSQIILMYTVLDKASELGITLTKEEEQQLKENKKQNIESAGGMAAYEKALKQSGMTDSLFDKVNRYSFIYDKLSKVLFSEGGPNEPKEDEIRVFFDKNYVTVSHILKKTVDSDGNPIGEEASAKKRAEADALLSKIRGGKDFMSVVKTENEDTGLTPENNYTYTFTYSALDPENAMVPEFEEAAFALDVGGVSGIVETQYGYHIIKRLPLDEAYLAGHKSSILSVMSDGLFEKLTKSWVSGAKVTYTDEYKNITLKNVNTYLGK
ncbi:MAG: peptidylprolyl isomerase [Bacillota bacterium]|nr:peptidylprolyl isomerase [Bacillota bacterium]